MKITISAADFLHYYTKKLRIMNSNDLPFQLVDTFYTGISFLKIHLMDVNDEYGQGHRCLRHLVRGRRPVRLWQR